ncbi:MAG: methyltransferase domain-containing protein [bacterium]|nr:methyltransferase domain-containing protein [bacterium]
MKNFFDIVAPIYEKLHFGAQKTFDRIESSVVFQPLDQVIDLGGGTGRIAKFLVNKVQKVIVVDASDGMLKQCLQRHPELSCVRAEAQNLPFANDSINKVIVVDSFHHFQNQKQVVKEIRRVLAKNGEVVIEEFNPLKIIGKLTIIMEKLFRMGSVFYIPSSLADLFSGNGFKVRLIEKNRAFYYLIGEKI